MATSGSLEKRREKKPESVQFWLAITAGSLLFHSLFMFGVSRSIKVAVVEPDAGAIDVEMLDASDFKSAPSEEPIVPAAAFKPEPFTPEPSPSPEFSPEPKPEPSVKPEPIVKPAVKKNPIVPTPKSPSSPKAPKSKTTNSNDTTPVTSGTELPGVTKTTGVRSVALTYEDGEQPEQQSSRCKDQFNDDPVSTLVLGKLPVLSIQNSSPLLPSGSSASITISFTATCPTSTNKKCDASKVVLSRDSVAYFGKATSMSSKDLDDTNTWADEMLSKTSVTSLTINTDAVDKRSTFWSVTVVLKG